MLKFGEALRLPNSSVNYWRIFMREKQFISCMQNVSETHKAEILKNIFFGKHIRVDMLLINGQLQIYESIERSTVSVNIF